MKIGFLIIIFCAALLLARPCFASTVEIETVVLPNAISVIKKGVVQIGKSFQGHKSRALLGIPSGFSAKMFGLKAEIGAKALRRPLMLEAGVEANPLIGSGLGVEHRSKISITQELRIAGTQLRLKLVAKEKHEQFDSAILAVELPL